MMDQVLHDDGEVTTVETIAARLIPMAVANTDQLSARIRAKTFGIVCALLIADGVNASTSDEFIMIKLRKLYLHKQRYFLADNYGALKNVHAIQALRFENGQIVKTPPGGPRGAKA